MRQLFFAISLFYSVILFAQVDTTQQIIKDRRNSEAQQQKPYVIMISVDGFRWDYPEKYNTAFLNEMGRQGIRAKYMMPSYPSLTFPNHYTLATGLYPSHHGLVGNNFYEPASKGSYSMGKPNIVRDKKWYGGTPLWVLAEENKMISASFYWVGSEAPVKGILPTYFYYYNEKIPIDKRIQVVVDWLKLPEDKRPHFINFYLSELDHDGHVYGPEDPRTGVTARWIDTTIQKLTQAVKTTGLDVNFVVVSDHGMTQVKTDEWIKTPSFDSSKVIVSPGGEIVQLYVKDKRDVDSIYHSLKQNAVNYEVFLKRKMPKRLRYGAKDDWYNRIGDIILTPIAPWAFGKKKPNPGAHGFDPFKVHDMRTVFFAWGPAFKSNKTVKPFTNVHVYPVVANILGLEYTEKIDGKKKLARKILKR